MSVVSTVRSQLGGPPAWESDDTVRRAIEIRDGVIQNPAILSFQHRAATYPHPRRYPAGADLAP